MAGQAANIHSIDALRGFRLALKAFEASVHDALTTLELEARRPVAWVEGDRSGYWVQQERKAADGLIEARLTLEKCELTTSADNRKFCYDERKLLEKAKLRLRLTEAKVQSVKRWRMQIRKETQEFQVQVSKMRRYMEHEFLGSVAALERMIEALQRYAEPAAPTAPEGSRTP
jgi:hypothetical protein